jgi:hypothetical protein
MRLSLHLFVATIAIAAGGCSTPDGGPKGERDPRKQTVQANPDPNSRIVESRRTEEILNGWKQTDRQFNLNQASFRSQSALASNAVRSNEFQFIDRTRPGQTFNGAGKYQGNTDSAWLGENRLRLGPAQSPGGYAAADRAANTGKGKVETSEWFWAGKKNPGRIATENGRPYLVQPRSQDAIDSDLDAAKQGKRGVGWQGEMRDMSIEEIRELLNKNK